eukprot:1416730-Rhodomonas_salina.1
MIAEPVPGHRKLPSAGYQRQVKSSPPSSHPAQQKKTVFQKKPSKVQQMSSPKPINASRPGDALCNWSDACDGNCDARIVLLQASLVRASTHHPPTSSTPQGSRKRTGHARLGWLRGTEEPRGVRGAWRSKGSRRGCVLRELSLQTHRTSSSVMLPRTLQDMTSTAMSARHASKSDSAVVCNASVFAMR